MSYYSNKKENIVLVTGNKTDQSPQSYMVVPGSQL